MMSCMDWDLQASEYSLTVYLFLMLSTVLIRKMSHLKSEKRLASSWKVQIHGCYCPLCVQQTRFHQCGHT